MVGSPRTGSTWLLNLLALHPHIRTIDEPLIGAHLGLQVAAIVGVQDAGASAAQSRVLDRYAEREDYFFSARYRDVWLPHLRALLLARLDAQFRDRGGDARSDYLVLKEPNGSEAADVLVEALPATRLLVLVRDGRDALDSVLDGLRPGAWASDVATVADTVEQRAAFIDSYAALWVHRTRTVLTALSNRPEGLGILVRYEELLANTAAQLSGIYDWLGLPTPTDVAEHVSRLSFGALSESVRGPGQFARAASPGLWRENLSAAEQERITAVMGSALADLGYPV